MLPRAAMAQSQCSRSFPPATRGRAHTLRCSLIGRPRHSRNYRLTCAGAAAQSSPPRQRRGTGRGGSGLQQDTTPAPEPLPQHLETPLTHADILRQEVSLKAQGFSQFNLVHLMHFANPGLLNAPAPDRSQDLCYAAVSKPLPPDSPLPLSLSCP